MNLGVTNAASANSAKIILRCACNAVINITYYIYLALDTNELDPNKHDSPLSRLF